MTGFQRALIRFAAYCVVVAICLLVLPVDGMNIWYWVTIGIGGVTMLIVNEFLPRKGGKS